MSESSLIEKINQIAEIIEKWEGIPVIDDFNLNFSIQEPNYDEIPPFDREHFPSEYGHFLKNIGQLSIRTSQRSAFIGSPLRLGNLKETFEYYMGQDDWRLRGLFALLAPDSEFDELSTVSEWAEHQGIANWYIAGLVGIDRCLWVYADNTYPYESRILHCEETVTGKLLHDPMTFDTALIAAFFELPEIKLLSMPEFDENFFEDEDSAVAVLEKNGDALGLLGRKNWDLKTISAALSQNGWSARFLLDTPYLDRSFMAKALKTLRGTDYRFPYHECERNLIVGLLERTPKIGEEEVLNIVHSSYNDVSPEDLPF